MSEDLLTKIKNNLNIVDVISEYLEITKKGNNFWCVCPFHADSNPSLSISEKKQLFKCFVCNVGGDIFKFVSEIEKIDWKDAMYKLAKKANIEFNIKESVPIYSENEKNKINLLNDAALYFQNMLFAHEGESALKYAKIRNLNSNVIQEFGIGFAPYKGLISFLSKKGYLQKDMINCSLSQDGVTSFFKNRLIFPIKNYHGDIVGFSGRSFKKDDQYKYVNSQENNLFNKKKLLYNWENAFQASKKDHSLIINEGFMDVIAMFLAGHKNAIALMGTALTNDHIKILLNSKIEIINIMLDGDEAGINSTIKLVQSLFKHNFELFIIKMPKNCDPDMILQKGGKKAIDKLIQTKQKILDYFIDYFFIEQENTNSDIIEKKLKKISQIIVFKNDLEKNFYLNKISKTINIDKKNLEEFFKIKKTYSKKIQSTKNSSRPIAVRTLQGMKNINAFKILISIIKNPELKHIAIKEKICILNEKLNSFLIFILNNNLNDLDDVPIKFQKLKPYLSQIKVYANNSEEFYELIERFLNEKTNHLILSYKKQINLSKTIKEKEEWIYKLSILLKEKR